MASPTCRWWRGAPAELALELARAQEEAERAAAGAAEADGELSALVADEAAGARRRGHRRAVSRRGPRRHGRGPRRPSGAFGGDRNLGGDGARERSVRGRGPGVARGARRRGAGALRAALPRHPGLGRLRASGGIASGRGCGHAARGRRGRGRAHRRPARCRRCRGRGVLPHSRRREPLPRSRRRPLGGASDPAGPRASRSWTSSSSRKLPGAPWRRFWAMWWCARPWRRRFPPTDGRRGPALRHSGWCHRVALGQGERGGCRGGRGGRRARPRAPLGGAAGAAFRRGGGPGQG